MHRVVKHATILGVAGVVSLAAYNIVANASTSDPPVTQPGMLEDLIAKARGEDSYSLGKLALLTRTMYFVDDVYVDPSRVDYEDMFNAGLDSVERRVPEVLFRRAEGSQLLHIAVGSYSSTLELREMNSSGAMLDELSRVAAVLEANLSEDVPMAEVEYSMINGVLGTLDPHSVLLPPAAAEEMDVENSGEFGGLGITITMREGRLTVDYPLPDTPAWNAGLKPDDSIVRIDGESTINMDLTEAVSKLRGRVGSSVLIHVERDGWDEPRPFTIERATIKINPVKGQLLEGGVGYIQITNFHAAVSGDLAAQLSQFRRENGGEIRGLVLDLRGNPGGFLHQAIEVSDRFLRNGSIVSTVDRHNRTLDESGASPSNTEAGYPLIVLVSANSASASEIVAGALKNQGRAVILGERTFGKGSVQNLKPNAEDGSTLKITTSKYLTPGDKSIQAIGIPPDIMTEPTIMVTEDGETHVAMYARERVTREADLDHSLEKFDELGEPPVYAVRYLREIDPDAKRPKSAELDLSDDWEVNFARDLILASPEEANRAEVLASVGTVVSTHRDRQEGEIEAAFEAIGLDWDSGPTTSKASLDVELDLGSDGVLIAGKENAETIHLRVTNTGSEPIYQLMAVSEASMEWLDGDEFFFGKLDPGETRDWPTTVQMIDGYRDEMGEVAFHFKDAGGADVLVSDHMVRTVGMPLPSFEWEFEVLDGGVADTNGDEDGVIEAGETVALRVTVHNVGSGPSTAAFAKVRNRSGKDVDLKVGTLELGEIAAGGSTTGDFVFQVRGARPELDLTFELGDQDRYDYAAVIRGGFYGYFTQTEELAIPVGKAGDWDLRSPPAVEVSRMPDLVSTNKQVVISGVAKDDDAVRDLIVYHRSEEDEGKVFFQGGDTGVTALPYTVDAELDPGWNVFVILVRDEQGLTAIRSVNVWHDPDGKVAQNASDPPIGG
jgi:carboxyl-terminal processing protease